MTYLDRLKSSADTEYRDNHIVQSKPTKLYITTFNQCSDEQFSVAHLALYIILQKSCLLITLPMKIFVKEKEEKM